MAAIGVHLGATCACAAVYKDGRADVVANDAGDRVTPAVVAFTENEEVVGLAAKQSRIRNVSNTVVKVKQILGRSSGDPQAEKYIKESKCLVVEKNGKLQYEIDNKLISPEDVAKLIFSKMKETAQSALGSDVNDVVITVPFDFGENQKNALGEAAAAAGFNVMRLIHEPSAALLAYGIGQDSPTGKSNVLVYKLGGTSLSITVIEVNSGIYRVLATDTDDGIGGVYFTEALAQHLASEFQRSCKHDIRGNPRAMMKLMNSADVAKHSLSTLGSANCFVDSLYDGLDFDCNVSRARFELICSSLFSKCVEAIKKLLEQVGFTAEDINKVVLCGGSARIPKLQQLIKDIFPNVELLSSIPPDEVIPIGAAIEAGILLGKENPSLEEEALFIECSAKDILLKGVDEMGADKFTVLFPSGTPLPARRQHTLHAPGSTSSVCLELYESLGKSPIPESSHVLRCPLEGGLVVLPNALGVSVFHWLAHNQKTIPSSVKIPPGAEEKGRNHNRRTSSPPLCEEQPRGRREAAVTIAPPFPPPPLPPPAALRGPSKMEGWRGAWYVPCLASHETLQELCRKENLRCKSIGITNKSLKSYEVEYLCDYKVEEGKEYYLVKWKGWPESSNTWEPQKNLKCPKLLENFLSDKDEYLSRMKEGRALKVRNSVKALKPAVADYIVKKAKQRIALQRWKEELNRKKNHKGMILVENTVDLEGPPIDFYYINEYKPAPGINVINGITTGCECSDCPAEKCCPKEAGFILAYNKQKKLKIQPGLPIYECNSFCRCGPDCPNRIVQKGTQYSLCIFRTNNGRGWGVKTLQKIKTNSFVMEYVGEVITSEEAERRGQFYDNQGNTYLFDLDYDSDEFTVDAARYGNVSHFVNHSCDPNLQVFNVFIDNLDLRLPRIALFSTRTIKAGEELTFDYQMKGSIDLTSDSADGLSSSRKRIRTVCKCGAVCCRGYLN